MRLPPVHCSANFGCVLVFLRQRGPARRAALQRDVGVGMLGLHLGQQQLGDILLCPALHFPGIVAGRGAIAPVERAFTGQDVARRAAAVTMPTLMVVWPGTVSRSGPLALRQLDLQLVQPVDEVAGEVNGADAEMRHGGGGPRRQ